MSRADLTRANATCIIQARMGSSRLPGKVLMELKPGLSLFKNVVLRLKASTLISRIVLATTENSDDDILVTYAKDLSIDVVRGPQDNVLARFVKAVQQYDPAIVVRVCADRPFVSAGLIDLAIRTLLDGQYAYVNNWVGCRKWPIGLDTEVVTAEALMEAYRSTYDAYDLEHVTPYIWQRPQQFATRGMVAEKDDSDVRLTIDEPADLAMVRAFFACHPEADRWEWEEIVSNLRRHPEILAINAHVGQR